MSAGDMVGMTENERREFAEAFERAHATGEISDRHFARARIQGAMARWQMQIYEAAGKPHPVPDNIYEGHPDVERVGIPAIDNALPFLKPNGGHPRFAFLSVMAYLLREKENALELSESRKKAAQEAMQHAMAAAALLDGIGNQLLAHEFRKLATLSTGAQYGRVSPIGELMPDALTGMHAGHGNKKSRDANIVIAIAQFFPDSPDFFSRQNNGYSVIARLAVLCELKAKNPAAYVATILKGRKRTTKTKPQRNKADMLSLFAPASRD